MISLLLNFNFFIAEPPLCKLQENSTFDPCYFPEDCPGFLQKPQFNYFLSKNLVSLQFFHVPLTSL